MLGTLPLMLHTPYRKLRPQQEEVLMMNGSWRLLIEALDGRFEPVGWRLNSDEAPEGETNLAPVNEHILGYWLELHCQAGNVIYRRFVHRLPVGLAASWEHWGRRQRSHTRFWLQIPQLDEARRVALFEQYIPSPEAKTLTCRQHFCATIPAVRSHQSRLTPPKPLNHYTKLQTALC